MVAKPKRILLVQGDTLPEISLLITDEDDIPVDIAGCTGATVHFRLLGETEMTPITAAVDTGAGTVSWKFSNGELAVDGEYEAEVQLQFGVHTQTLYHPYRLRVRPQYD